MTLTVITPVRTWRALPHRPKPAKPRPLDLSADFAAHVESQLDGPVLRYSQRLALIKEAARRGVGRFEANLVIASVLHARGIGQQYTLPPKPTWLAPALTILATQSAILATAWWLFG